MKAFKLLRKEDVSGVSGTGVVAEGVVFHDGKIALSWFGAHHTVELIPNMESCVAIHGHGGRTVVVFDEDPLEETERRMRVLKKYLRRASSVLDRHEANRKRLRELRRQG